MLNAKLAHYLCSFDAAKNYDAVLTRDTYPTQGRDLNDAEAIFDHRLTAIANAVFSDGDIISGAEIIVDPENGNVRTLPGMLYIKGAMRAVPEATFTIPVTGSIAVGIYLTDKVITELEDPELYNQEASLPSLGEPGSCRLQRTPSWGFAAEGGAQNFYPVYTVDDAVVRAKTPPPNLDLWRQALAQYDRASTNGGTYIGKGMVVRYAGTADTGAQVYTISEGEARAYGHGVELTTSRRIHYPAEPDLRLIDTEVHTADGSGSQRVSVAHPPIRMVTNLRVTRQKTVSIQHGSPGSADTLPDTSVVGLTKVWQGETVFVASTDYKKTGDKVDWGPVGNEPAYGSTYYCTYTYISYAEPEDLDHDGFSVTDAVAGTSIIVTYQQALPRKDRLCVTQDGAFTWIKGIASELNPRDPEPPKGFLPLATVLQTWRDGVEIFNDGPRSMSFDEIKGILDLANYCLTEVARNRLESSAATREAGAKVGMFVDPLLDDSGRDQGIAQTASVFGGEMMLPITATVHPLQFPLDKPVFPAYTPVPVLEQLLRTGSMQINPYMSFGILPAKVLLNPSVDRWTQSASVWTSAVTEEFGSGSLSSVRTTTQVVSTEVKQLEFLRQIRVSVNIDGFGAGEHLNRVIFDGIQVEFTPSAVTADSAGRCACSFMIPANIPSGAKTVTVHGQGGTVGTAVFVGQGTLTVQTLRQVNTISHFNPTITVASTDPLCQTFVLEANTMACGVDLWFTAKGGEARAQIVEVENGTPTRRVVAEGTVLESNIIATGGGHTRILFDTPVWLLGGAEYGIVVRCNDAVTSVAVADRSEFDPYMQKWVTSQPYTIGVLLSSSNAMTWTAHQDRDMTFRLLAADFVPGMHEVDMGSVTVTGATDLILYATDETHTAETRVEYLMTLPDTTTMTVASGQPARLVTPMTGTVSVKARLYGTSVAAPLLWPGAQIVAGVIANSGDYYGRSISALTARKAVLIYDAVAPSGSTVTPEVQVDSGEWQPMTQSGTVTLGDGVTEFTMHADLSAATMVKARFSLTGGAAARPSVRNIRLMAVA